MVVFTSEGSQSGEFGLLLKRELTLLIDNKHPAATLDH
jgi:hypothetical protein